MQLAGIDTRPVTPRVDGSLRLGAPDALGRTWVSAASGLAEAGGAAWVVSDEYGELARFDDLGSAGALLPGLPPQGRRPDLESLVAIPQAQGGALLAAFGSGSATDGSRNGALAQRIGADGAAVGAPQRSSLKKLYKALDARLPMGVNVEGAAVRGTADGAELLLFHRGRLPGDRNVVFRLDAARAAEALADGHKLTKDVLLGSTEVDLGTLHGAPLGFSDATALPDGRIAFTASAEGSAQVEGADRHADGAVLGSAIGVLGPDLRVQQLHPLDGPPRKVEGIAPARALDPRAGADEFVLVTDPDDAKAASEVLRVDLAPHPD